MPTIPRAKTIDELKALGEQFTTDAGYDAGLAFQPRPTDVIITPYGKSGTTWLQQICHSLRTRGNMDFEEITAMTPWIEVAQDVGWDIHAEQVAQPRLYKSHLTAHTVPKGGRYIVSVRNPLDVAVSLYRFLGDWWFDIDSIDIEEFVDNRFLDDPDNGGYWVHLASWWERRNDDDVLLLCYENMRQNLTQTIETVAGFIGIALDDELREIVLHQSSKEFMLVHKGQFDDNIIQKSANQRFGLPFNSTTAKITAGAGNDPRFQLSDRIKDEFATIWQRLIAEPYGLADYAALREAIGCGL